MDAALLLRRLRRRSGLSQRELARRAGTSAAAVCLYERGDRMPRTDTLARLVAAAGATLAIDAVTPPEGLDLEANARALEDLLALADHLPHRSDEEVAFPPFRALAR